MRDYRFNPSVMLNTAFSMFNGSKKKKTIAVEGLNDERFFNQWFGDSDKVRFTVAGNKENVVELYNKYLNHPSRSKNNIFFSVDLDWDVVHSKNLPAKDYFLCNSFCLDTNSFHYNDMESFLVNTGALKKILASYDIDFTKINLPSLLSSMEEASRCVGKYKAADDIIKNKLQLRSSILNGLHAVDYFDAELFSINEDALQKNLPQWSNYKHHVDDLIEEALSLDKKVPTKWALSRGHDITSMLAAYIEFKSDIRVTPEKIEGQLRLSCELSEFKNTPMYLKMIRENLI